LRRRIPKTRKWRLDLRRLQSEKRRQTKTYQLDNQSSRGIMVVT